MQADRHAEASRHRPINLFTNLFTDLFTMGQEEQQRSPHHQLSTAACAGPQTLVSKPAAEGEPRGT